jgi:hypothetical protein
MNQEVSDMTSTTGVACMLGSCRDKRWVTPLRACCSSSSRSWISPATRPVSEWYSWCSPRFSWGWRSQPVSPSPRSLRGRRAGKLTKPTGSTTARRRFAVKGRRCSAGRPRSRRAQSSRGHGRAHGQRARPRGLRPPAGSGLESGATKSSFRRTEDRPRRRPAGEGAHLPFGHGCVCIKRELDSATLEHDR